MPRAAAALIAVVALAALLQLWVRHAQHAPPPPSRDECGGCHLAVSGLEPGHAALSCAACHLGNTRTTNPRLAHVGLVRIPGNEADVDRTCGAAGCHEGLPHRLRANIMNTMNGVVSVDRWVFGEQPTPTARTPVSALGHSPADTHLRNLCVSCHLGNPKTEVGPLDELSRGGGCNACHLRYSAAARAQLGKKLEPALPFAHAALFVKPEPIACFGCHARSGRVSLNVDGWQEFGGDAGDAPVKTLADGRVVKRGPGDVHAERGLGCVDCHGSWEVMGDGTPALHREQQSTLQCTDCHLVAAPVTRTLAQLDAESQAVARLEGFAAPARAYLTVAKSGAALVNTFRSDGGVFLTGKYSGRTVPLRPPAKACTEGHAALSCASCHDAWVPQCVSCHTRFDRDGGMFDLLANEEAPGEWLEEGGPPRAEPATLGVRMLADGGRRIEEFAPGMVLTLEGRFHRLFAPVFAHTVRKEVRRCEGCHANPVALGYGRGVLRYEVDTKAWRFSPQFPVRPEDGLPEDAWIGFLQTRGPGSTTREDTRPFTVEEQRRILAVGVK